MKRSREDLRIFVNGAVLDERSLARADLRLGLEALAQEVDLEMEAPARHVGVEHVEVRVINHGLVVREPAQLGAQAVRELGLADADVPRDGEKVASVHDRTLPCAARWAI